MPQTQTINFDTRHRFIISHKKKEKANTEVQLCVIQYYYFGFEWLQLPLGHINE